MLKMFQLPFVMKTKYNFPMKLHSIPPILQKEKEKKKQYYIFYRMPVITSLTYKACIGGLQLFNKYYRGKIS